MLNQPGMKFVRGMQAIRLADAANQFVFFGAFRFLIQQELDGAGDVAAVLPLLIIDETWDD